MLTICAYLRGAKDPAQVDVSAAPHVCAAVRAVLVSAELFEDLQQDRCQPVQYRGADNAEDRRRYTASLIRGLALRCGMSEEETKQFKLARRRTNPQAPSFEEYSEQLQQQPLPFDQTPLPWETAASRNFQSQRSAPTSSPSGQQPQEERRQQQHQ